MCFTGGKNNTMANVKNAVNQFSKSHLGKNGVQSVMSVIDNFAECLSVGVTNLEKNRSKLPKEFLGYRIVYKESGKIIAHKK